MRALFFIANKFLQCYNCLKYCKNRKEYAYDTNNVIKFIDL